MKDGEIAAISHQYYESIVFNTRIKIVPIVPGTEWCAYAKFLKFRSAAVNVC